MLLPLGPGMEHTSLIENTFTIWLRCPAIFLLIEIEWETCFIIDGAASREPKRRNFSSVDVAPRKRSCTFFYRIYPKENIVFTGHPADFSYKN
jgi:hypothetical protein